MYRVTCLKDNVVEAVYFYNIYDLAEAQAQRKAQELAEMTCLKANNFIVEKVDVWIAQRFSK